MKFSLILPIYMILFVIAGIAGCLQNEEIMSPPKASINPDHGAMAKTLATMQDDIVAAIIRLDKETGSSAIKLGKSGLSGDAANSILARLAASDPAILTAITFDRNGTVRAAAPLEARVLIGENLGNQTVVQDLFARNQPLMSDLFPLAQGGYGSVIEYPVYSEEGQVIGAVSITFSPDVLIAPYAESATEGTRYSAMVAQTDGRVLYDPDPEEVGRETFNESLYAEFPEILEFARQYSGNKSGYATYSFYDTGFGNIVNKEAFWTTIGIHGTEWRLIIIREI